MIIDVIQQYEKGRDDKLQACFYGDCVKVRIGFVLGYEEEELYDERVNGYIPLEKAFTRICSPHEYVRKTSYGKVMKDDIFFANTFTSLCNFFGVEIIQDKKKAKAIRDKEKHCLSLINALTKGLKEGSRIEVPDVLLESDEGYAYK